MPQMPIHRKAKRAALLTKRTQYLKKYGKERSYRPLYEKLKNNNSYLAKALSLEKQNCQSLFSQNLALIAEVQELRLACTTRDNVISNVFNNAKEMLKMLVTMSGYMTNTISICQEFTASNTNMRLSSVSSGRKESFRRLSTKSPARGVVKPMVSGHTITKPTINLSRVNMQNITNTSRLSDIQEVSTPDRSEDINETRSPIAVSIPITQLRRYENGRTCRLPERLAVSSPRVNKDSEQRLRKKKSRSRRMSGSFSRSNRWSGESTRNSTEYVSQLSSPTVKLNDVSKLLQNSQSINIRTLEVSRTSVTGITQTFGPTFKSYAYLLPLASSATDRHGALPQAHLDILIDDNKIDDVEMQESSDDGPHNTSDRNVVIPETQLSIKLDEVDEGYAQTPKHSNAQTKEKNPRKDWNKNSNVSENSRLSQNNVETWQDPLEGPSWLLDNISISDDNATELDHPDVTDINNRASHSNSKVTTTYSDESSDSEDAKDELPPLPDLTNMEILNKGSFIADRIKNDHSLDEDAIDDTFCAILPTSTAFGRERNFDHEEDDNTTNMARFITMRRGNSAVIEETEDFTLMMSRPPMRSLNFDINELRLPILEGSIINPTIAANDIDSEVTTAIQRITNFRMPSISNQSANEPEIDSTTTIKLPLVLVHDHDRISTPEKGKHSNKNKKTKLLNPKDNMNHAENMTVSKRIKQKSSQDPSAAKVVLEKLNESNVKPRTPSPDDIFQSNGYVSDTASNQEGNARVSKSDNNTSDRPRRRRATIEYKEPNLNKKLRRNH
ncbi:uncharacterized protein LOC116841395 isoform X1 [Odontomachus brunneus]|uniref:uncharacterized protein LOC116841395 isoform X1 n=1 Tax=Odontomachus brunneus TaxID=486640 RepID=UPI0013F26C1C|nr:uncharacterized protein LOC116841395 isoform X1 [Odontomachus brunneus]XP_032665150.1 uncharacterized protein LOC116841395 isoform X1 [Odontomachus brunneus]XP_032665152.1 uncharacterized protein LOC116841395 isoform X1 [Odontomachus brunneus]